MAATGSVNIPIDVLLIEDSPADVRLMEEAFRDVNKSIRLHFASDGLEAMEFLKGDGTKPVPHLDLILLDLNLPNMDGRDVLARIKSDPALRTIPTVILTMSAAESDILRCYELQANCYLQKPANWEMFYRLVKSINDFWLTKVTLLQRNRDALTIRCA
jgi:two-component system, chemotaxis family, response regulator Rcp1